MSKPKVAPARPIRQALSDLPGKYDDVVMAIDEAEAGLRILQAIDNGELQQVAHYTPLEAGTALLPITFIMLFLSARSGAMASRIGPRLQMSVGPLIVAIGMVLFARIDASGNYFVEVLPAVLVFGLGLAVTVAPLTSTVLAAAPEATGVAVALPIAAASSPLAAVRKKPRRDAPGANRAAGRQLGSGDDPDLVQQQPPYAGGAQPGRGRGPRGVRRGARGDLVARSAAGDQRCRGRLQHADRLSAEHPVRGRSATPVTARVPSVGRRNDPYPSGYKGVRSDTDCARPT